MNEVTKRMITGLFLVAFIVLGTRFSTPFYFTLVSGLILLLAAHEWARLIKLSFSNTLLFLTAMSALLLLKSWIPTTIILGLGCLFWIAMFYPVLTYKQSQPKWAQSQLILMGMGVMVLYPFWIGLLSVYNSPNGLGKPLLLLLLIIVALEDTGAYFTGRQWGRHKLLPHVSPGKTWEGVAGGVCCSLLAVLAIRAYFPHLFPLKFISVIFVVLIVAILGDLFESLIKRIQGVKDSGTCLPGHGGILDRIDSLTAAMPFFALGCAI